MIYVRGKEIQGKITYQYLFVDELIFITINTGIAGTGFLIVIVDLKRLILVPLSGMAHVVVPLWLLARAGFAVIVRGGGRMALKISLFKTAFVVHAVLLYPERKGLLECLFRSEELSSGGQWESGAGGEGVVHAVVSQKYEARFSKANSLCCCNAEVKDLT